MKSGDDSSIALYFRGPKLSRLEHAKQFHKKNNFHDFWYGPHFLLQLQHFSKAHLELLVASNLVKIFVVHKFTVFPNSRKNTKF